ncbi:MAG: helix-turn-helix domain-containing protein [Longimicrobiales bacterium]
MAENRSELGKLIEEGLKEAIAFERGELRAPVTRRPITTREADVAPPPVYRATDVRRIRKRMRLSQTLFAKALNVSGVTVQAWEQGKRTPDGPSLRLLELASRTPSTFIALLTGRDRTPALVREGKRPA